MFISEAVGREKARKLCPSVGGWGGSLNTEAPWDNLGKIAVFTFWDLNSASAIRLDVEDRASNLTFAKSGDESTHVFHTQQKYNCCFKVNRIFD